MSMLSEWLKKRKGGDSDAEAALSVLVDTAVKHDVIKPSKYRAQVKSILDGIGWLDLLAGFIPASKRAEYKQAIANIKDVLSVLLDILDA